MRQLLLNPAHANKHGAEDKPTGPSANEGAGQLECEGAGQLECLPLLAGMRRSPDVLESSWVTRFVLFSVLGAELRASHMEGECSTTELHLQSRFGGLFCQLLGIEPRVSHMHFSQIKLVKVNTLPTHPICSRIISELGLWACLCRIILDVLTEVERLFHCGRHHSLASILGCTG